MRLRIRNERQSKMVSEAQYHFDSSDESFGWDILSLHTVMNHVSFRKRSHRPWADMVRERQSNFNLFGCYLSTASAVGWETYCTWPTMNTVF